MNSFVLSRISKGEITNLEIPVVFLKNVCAQLSSFFWDSPIYRQETNFWWNFCQCAELDHPFLHLLFVMTFSYKLFPSFHTIDGVMHKLYISWLGSYRHQTSNAMTANVKCIVIWLYVAKKSGTLSTRPLLAS